MYPGELINVANENNLWTRKTQRYVVANKCFFMYISCYALVFIIMKNNINHSLEQDKC